MGDDQDPDGYSLVVDGQPGISIGLNEQLTVRDLAVALHTFQLTGIEANCRQTTVDHPVGSNTYTVNVFCLPPSSGTIYYTENSQFRRISSMTAIGGDTRTFGPSYVHDFSVSPDGEQIAYQQRTPLWDRGDDIPHIFIMSTDGSNQVQLTGSTGIGSDANDWRGDKPRRRDKLLKAADELAKHVGVKPACAALEVSRSTLYRRRGPSTGQQQPRPTPARALSETERGEVFDTLCSERFVDRSPAEVVATLLDEEVYLCSERTMYRVLASEVPVQERRAQRTHPEYKKPEWMATAPNQVWSWDITRLLGPKKWSYYYLYVILDIYSRYVVGWMVADRENSALAGRLIQQSCLKHGVQPRVLTLHSDRGAPMTSQCTAQLLADLGVTRSLSRPQVSDDNPFSEAQSKP